MHKKRTVFNLCVRIVNSIMLVSIITIEKRIVIYVKIFIYTEKKQGDGSPWDTMDTRRKPCL